MRAFVCLFVATLLVAASTVRGESDAKWAAEQVRKALGQREPIPWSKSRLVVPTAQVAIGIHTSIVRAAFGEEALRDKPFVAIRSSDGEIYSAEKIRGEWHIHKAVIVL